MHQILKDLLPKIHRRSRVSSQVCRFSVFESQVGHRLYWLIYFMIFLSPKIKSENSTLNWATTYLLSSKIWDHMVRVSRLFVKLQNYKFVPEGHISLRPIYAQMKICDCKGRISHAFLSWTFFIVEGMELQENNKHIVSVKHNNILFLATCFGHYAIIRPSLHKI